MRAGRALPLAAVIAVTGAAPVVAQNTEFDAALNYAARDEILLPGDTEKSDNDIFRLTTALSWDAGYDGRMRVALELGVRNEDFNGNFPAVTGCALLHLIAQLLEPAYDRVVYKQHESDVREKHKDKYDTDMLNLLCDQP